jgi:NADPH-dependent 2,4-dienoyl-CoA reductase/sulfur reductase-like enzyme/nitrite reductase/ring-hydroxylating ferredoxin subunit
MSGSDPKLSGPDFEQGVDSKLLAEGAMLVGHALGEPVLVVRRGAEVLAIGTTCTHYGGPLAEGLLVDDTVRCPWHHACFSLRTGEAIRAPALNPIACFTAEERGGRLYVVGKRSVTPRSTSSSTTLPDSILIVGAGAAGNAAAEMLRREGYAGRVAMVGADASVPYDRPNLSKDYLAGTAPEEWIPLRSTDFYAEQKIDLRLGAEVKRVDAAAKSVWLADGTKLAYGALLLATGATPVQLQLPGGDLPHVHYLRSLSDARRIVASMASASRAVVVGASFIGLEVAAALRTRGLDVTVVAPEAPPLVRVMGEGLGAAIQKLHENHGVAFHLGAKPVSIHAGGVTLDDGTTLPADLVVMGVGVRPATGLADAAGLRIDRGVLVDACLRTSAPDIFAAGDIARFPDARTGEAIRVEHWVVAERQGQVAARNMLGANQPFDAVPFFWSAHYDVSISYVGHAEKWDRIDVTGTIEGHDCALAYRSGTKTLAIATVGRDATSLEAEAAMERGDEDTLHRIVP